MIGDSVLKSSEKHTWETPQEFFDKINNVYNFTLDCCAEKDTAKVRDFYTVEDDALTKSWFGNVWCNPPYGREQGKFVSKAIQEVLHGNAKSVVVLIPSRTDTKLWQDTIFKHAKQIIFIKGRLRFGGSKENAPFPSALVIFGQVKDLDIDGYKINLDY